MGPLRRINATPVSLLAALAASPALAFGYIDPGSGSYMLQMLAAGLLGAGFALKGAWQNVKNFLRNLGSRDR